MIKNKSYIFVFFGVMVVFGLWSNIVRAESVDSSIPDNVQITSNNDGSQTTVVINSKPGFTTNVSTSCVNGKCTHKATSTKLTTKDIQTMQDSVKKQQEAMQKFFKAQQDFFQQQQKMFQDLWGVTLF